MDERTELALRGLVNKWKKEAKNTWSQTDKKMTGLSSGDMVENEKTGWLDISTT